MAPQATVQDFRAVNANRPMGRTQTKSETIPTTFGPCNVLVADDEHLVAMGIANNARDLGHTVIGIAADGDAAVNMAREKLPDLALLDIRMPKMNGTDVAMILQQELGIPSVIVSAYSDDEHLQRIHGFGMTSGVYGYLLKPVSQEELRVTIGVALQRAAVDRHQSGRINQLETNLANRRIVEQAKWILVEKFRMVEAQAHDRLQKIARDRRQPLVEIAQIVVDTGSLPE